LRERVGVRVSLKALQNHLQNALGVREHIMVPEADYSVAVPLQPSSPGSVGVFRMLTPVDLYNEAALPTAEVDDIGAKRPLAFELVTVEPPVPEFAPEALLGVRRILTKLNRMRADAAVHVGHDQVIDQESPSPNPLPQAGEGFTPPPTIATPAPVLLR
jgi:hypothetical protein